MPDEKGFAWTALGLSYMRSERLISSVGLGEARRSYGTWFGRFFPDDVAGSRSMKPVHGLDTDPSGHAEAAQRSVEALKFAGDAVFADSEAFYAILQRKPG